VGESKRPVDVDTAAASLGAPANTHADAPTFAASQALRRLEQARKFYREFKGWMLGLAATGTAALLVPVVIDLPPSAEKQCEVAVSVEAGYRDRNNLTPAQRRLYNDAVRELDECMQ
jgi:hypothetical protein